MSSDRDTPSKNAKRLKSVKRKRKEGDASQLAILAAHQPSRSDPCTSNTHTHTRIHAHTHMLGIAIPSPLPPNHTHPQHPHTQQGVSGVAAMPDTWETLTGQQHAALTALDEVRNHTQN
jgi:hypothetical protein